MPFKVYLQRAASAAVLALAAQPGWAASFKIIYQATALDGAVGYSSQLFTPLPVAGGGVIVETAGGGGADQQIILLTPAAAGQPYTRTLIHDFNNGCSSDGGNVNGLLEADPQGNVWGFTDDDCGTPGGTLFKLTQPATPGGTWSYQVVLQLPASLATSYAGTGYNDFTFDASGNLYGLLNLVSNAGLCTTATLGCGIVFEIPAVTTAGSAAVFRIVAEFPASNGGSAFAGVTRDSKGNLYASEYAGGAAGFGAIWQASPPARHATTWTVTDIHDFGVQLDQYHDSLDGIGPVGAPVVGPGGVLYGASNNEGPGGDDNGVIVTPPGLVWSLTPPKTAGGAWTEKNIYVLPDGVGNLLQNPIYPPLLTKSGRIATLVNSAGGAGPAGHPTGIQGGVLEVSRAGGATLLNKGFAAYGVRNGALSPDTKLTQDSAGNLYGSTDNYYTTKNGGTRTPAVIYEITP